MKSPGPWRIARESGSIYIVDCDGSAVCRMMQGSTKLLDVGDVMDNAMAIVAANAAENEPAEAKCPRGKEASNG